MPFLTFHCRFGHHIEADSNFTEHDRRLEHTANKLKVHFDDRERKLQNDTGIGRGESDTGDGRLRECSVFEHVSVWGGSRRAFSVAWTGKALCQHRGVMGVSRVDRGRGDECVSI